jgi:ethanolamine transporter
VIIGKLVGGITAVLFAMLLANRMIASIEKTPAAASKSEAVSTANSE